jgi:hypothetical protein
LKIIYYVTDLGLGHASRSVAIIREIMKNKNNVIIRSNDPLGFLKKSLPGVKIVKGQTDFMPVLSKKNELVFNEYGTLKNLKKWMKEIPDKKKFELGILKKEKPDLVISDMSFLPFIVTENEKIKSILISNFVWNESLNISKTLSNKIKNYYEKADKIFCLPFGTKMKFKHSECTEIVARQPTVSKNKLRKELGIKQNEKLVLLSLAGIKNFEIKKSPNVKIIDLSNYSIIKKFSMNNLVEGQNLINAADLVICKCGYGFISECLTNGTRFCYVLDKKHKESYGIHLELIRNGINNRIFLRDLYKKTIDEKFILSYKKWKFPFYNKKLVGKF